MKKLMIAAAIVCVAAISQAASVSWGSGKKYVDPTTGKASGTLPDGGKIALVVLSDTTGWSDGTWSGTSATVTELDTAKPGTGKSAGALSKTTLWTYSDGMPFDDGDVLAVVFKDASGNYNQLAYYDSAKEGGIGAAVTDTLTVSGLADDQDLWSKSFQIAGSGNYTANVVPEPTSGLLLLLGVAGLALRRRRA